MRVTHFSKNGEPLEPENRLLIVSGCIACRSPSGQESWGARRPWIAAQGAPSKRGSSAGTARRCDQHVPPAGGVMSIASLSTSPNSLASSVKRRSQRRWACAPPALRRAVPLPGRWRRRQDSPHAQNLIINGLKYTTVVGVTLRWREVPPAQESDPQRRLLEVEDTGPGFHAGPGSPPQDPLKAATPHSRGVSDDETLIESPSHW